MDVCSGGHDVDTHYPQMYVLTDGHSRYHTMFPAESSPTIRFPVCTLDAPIEEWGRSVTVDTSVSEINVFHVRYPRRHTYFLDELDIRIN